MVEKLSRIKELGAASIVSVGDSSTDLSMMIPGSRFIGFNPARQRARDAFENAGVPMVDSKDLRDIWEHIFEGESFSQSGVGD